MVVEGIVVSCSGLNVRSTCSAAAAFAAFVCVVSIYDRAVVIYTELVQLASDLLLIKV